MSIIAARTKILIAITYWNGFWSVWKVPKMYPSLETNSWCGSYGCQRRMTMNWGWRECLDSVHSHTHPFTTWVVDRHGCMTSLDKGGQHDELWGVDVGSQTFALQLTKTLVCYTPLFLRSIPFSHLCKKSFLETSLNSPTHTLVYCFYHFIVQTINSDSFNTKRSQSIYYA